MLTPVRPKAMYNVQNVFLALAFNCLTHNFYPFQGLHISFYIHKKAREVIDLHCTVNSTYIIPISGHIELSFVLFKSDILLDLPATKLFFHRNLFYPFSYSLNSSLLKFIPFNKSNKNVLFISSSFLGPC